MNDIVGPLKYGKKDEEVFLGKELGQQKNYSEEKSILIDQEISTLVKNAESNADKVLLNFKHQLDDIAQILLDKETISGDEMVDIINGVKKEEEVLEEKPKKVSRRKKNKPE